MPNQTITNSAYLNFIMDGEYLSGATDVPTNAGYNVGVLNRPLNELLANDNELLDHINGIIDGSVVLSAEAIRGALDETDGLQNDQIETDAGIEEAKLTLTLTTVVNQRETADINDASDYYFTTSAELANEINSLYKAQSISSSALDLVRLNNSTQIPTGFLTPFGLPQDVGVRGTIGTDADRDATLCVRTENYEAIQMALGDSFLGKQHVNANGILFNLEGLNTTVPQDCIFYTSDLTDVGDSDAEGKNVRNTAPNTATNPTRQDLVFLEFWAENVDKDAGYVFPKGQVQNGNEMQDANAQVLYEHSANALLVTDPTFAADYLAERSNHTFILSNGDYAQWRYRIRIVNDASSLDSGDIQVQACEASPNASYTFSKAKNDIGYYTNTSYTHANLIDETQVGAIPLFAVHRRNEGIFHVHYNPNGTGVPVRDTSYRTDPKGSDTGVYEIDYGGVWTDCFDNDRRGGYNVNTDTGIRQYLPWSTYVEDLTLPADVNIVDNEFTVAQDFVSATGEEVLVKGTDVPDGLTASTEILTVPYYVIYVDANTIKLATTYANAIAGTAIDIIDAGTTTMEIIPTWRMRLTGSTAYLCGHSLSGVSGRPDETFFDVVDKYDIEDQRHRVSFEGYDFDALMNKNMDALFKGALLNDFMRLPQLGTADPVTQADKLYNLDAYVTTPGDNGYNTDSGIKGRALLIADYWDATYHGSTDSVAKLVKNTDTVWKDPLGVQNEHADGTIDGIRRIWSDQSTIDSLSDVLSTGTLDDATDSGTFDFDTSYTLGGDGTVAGAGSTSDVSPQGSRLDTDFVYASNEITSIKIAMNNQMSGDIDGAGTDDSKKLVQFVSYLTTSKVAPSLFYIEDVPASDAILNNLEGATQLDIDWETALSISSDGRTVTIDLSSMEIPWSDPENTPMTVWVTVPIQYPAGEDCLTLLSLDGMRHLNH